MPTTPDALTAIYEDLHRHPELGGQEHRTAGIVADHLRALGYDVTTGVGGTGVVATLERGEGGGPTVLLRADMDGLPVKEETGLPYASTATATTADGEEHPVMHACGHDVHVTCLLGAAAQLVADDGWRGRVLLVFQPDEENGNGARDMVADGLFERFGKPDVVLGQHVAPLPAGVLGGARGGGVRGGGLRAGRAARAGRARVAARGDGRSGGAGRGDGAAAADGGRARDRGQRHGGGDGGLVPRGLGAEHHPGAGGAAAVDPDDRRARAGQGAGGGGADHPG